MSLSVHVLRWIGSRFNSAEKNTAISHSGLHGFVGVVSRSSNIRFQFFAAVRSNLAFIGIVHIQAGLVMMRHMHRRPVAYSIARWAFVL
jgi:hypothetical protein